MAAAIFPAAASLSHGKRIMYLRLAGVGITQYKSFKRLAQCAANGILRR